MTKQDYLAKVKEVLTDADWNDATLEVMRRLRNKANDNDSIIDYLVANAIDYIDTQLYDVQEVDIEAIDYSDDTWRHERVDNMVDIYYNDIYESAIIFSSYVDDARSEWLIGDDTDLAKQIQIGQYYFWDSFIGEVLQILENSEI